jgi:hypothetical protein
LLKLKRYSEADAAFAALGLDTTCDGEVRYQYEVMMTPGWMPEQMKKGMGSGYTKFLMQVWWFRKHVCSVWDSHG